MVSLFLSSVLFFFISYNLGFCFSVVTEKMLGSNATKSLFETFINGVVLTFIYVNILSFLIEVDFIVLIPLFLVSVFVCYRYSTFIVLKGRLRGFWAQVRIGSISFVAFPVISLFFVYWIAPPINADSAAYHYLTIEWFERFKLVPGLANIHGRFAFNPASFIISAPYCFTDVFHQSLYPVNGVLITCFFIWFCNLIVRTAEISLRILLLIIMAFWLRLSLVNISSPSSDALAVMLATFVMIRVLELLYSSQNKPSLPVYLPVYICFCITVKLSLLPMVLLLPLVIGRTNISSKAILYGICLSIAILVPWLIRNFILSGYFFYPLTYSDFNFYVPDWKVPDEVVYLDRIYTKYGPYYLDGTVEEQMNLGFFRRNVLWMGVHLKNKMFVELFLLTASVLSPLCWLWLTAKRIMFSKHLFRMWGLVYIMVIIWILNSPDYRFGSVYLYISAMIPALYLLKALFNFKILKRIYLLLICCYPMLLGYYTYMAFFVKGAHRFTLSSCWLLPLKDARYLPVHRDKAEKTLLNDGKTVLYFADSTCECINLPLPCMPWKYGRVEMRGKKITDGFRNVENRVKDYYPFVTRPF